MSHDHKQHEHGHHNHQTHPADKKKPIHHDWKFWVAVVLMIAAMGAYVLSDDESLQPGGGEGPQVPAMAE